MCAQNCEDNFLSDPQINQIPHLEQSSNTWLNTLLFSMTLASNIILNQAIERYVSNNLLRLIEMPNMLGVNEFI